MRNLRTIRPVLEGAHYDYVSLALRQSLRDYAGINGDPLSTPWDVLSTDEKKEIIVAAAQGRKQNFYDDRKVHGLIYKPSFKLYFSKPSRFMGVNYPTGYHAFNSINIFKETSIEFSSPDNMTDDLGFELHIRSTLNAGENLHSSRSLQQGLGFTPGNVHIHIVAPKPEMKYGKEQPILAKTRAYLHKLISKSIVPSIQNKITVFRANDYARIAMLYFDLQMIGRKIPMTAIELVSGGENFSVPEHNNFANIRDALFDKTDNIKAFSKNGTVGYRSSHYYDQKNVWGIEVRYLSPFLDQAKTAQALSVLQDKMISKEYFLTEKQGAEYFERFPTAQKNFHIFANHLLYNNDFNVQLSRYKMTKQQEDFLKLEAEKNDFIKMLFHDWSFDPLYINRPTRLEQVQQAQKYAIQLLFRGVPSVEVMAIFAKQSALAYDINNLILDPDRFNMYQ